jgi:ABC-2 type transport system ATP-binding protein
LFGTTYQQQGRAIREQIGVVLQETNLYKRFTVRETLQMFASLYQRSVPLDPLIADLGLTEKANTQLQLHKLSGGQRQRVYLGAALVNDPKMLFLDEPTTGLDPHTRRNTWELIRQLKSQGRGILLTTHYMEEAAYLADRIAIMYAGKIIAAGTAAELIKDYGGAYTFVARWANAPAQFAAKWQASALHQTVGMRATSNAKEVEFVLADPVKSVRAILAFLDQEGLAPEHFELRQSTLEDVFIKLTGKNLSHAAEISA